MKALPAGVNQSTRSAGTRSLEGGDSLRLIDFFPVGSLDGWFAGDALGRTRPVADQRWGEDRSYYDVSSLDDGCVMSGSDDCVSRQLRTIKSDHKKENASTHFRKVNGIRQDQNCQ